MGFSRSKNMLHTLGIDGLITNNMLLTLDKMSSALDMYMRFPFYHPTKIYRFVHMSSVHSILLTSRGLSRNKIKIVCI